MSKHKPAKPVPAEPAAEVAIDPTPVPVAEPSDTFGDLLDTEVELNTEVELTPEAVAVPLEADPVATTTPPDATEPVTATPEEIAQAAVPAVRSVDPTPHVEADPVVTEVVIPARPEWNPETVPEGKHRFCVTSHRGDFEPFEAVAGDESEAISIAVNARNIDASRHRWTVARV
jgi:hypothetical protein